MGRHHVGSMMGRRKVVRGSMVVRRVLRMLRVKWWLLSVWVDLGIVGVRCDRLTDGNWVAVAAHFDILLLF